MKKLTINQIQLFKGGCQRYIRRYVRVTETAMQAGKDELLESLLDAYVECIYDKYGR